MNAEERKRKPTEEEVHNRLIALTVDLRKAWARTVLTEGEMERACMAGVIAEFPVPNPDEEGLRTQYRVILAALVGVLTEFGAISKSAGMPEEQFVQIVAGATMAQMEFTDQLFRDYLEHQSALAKGKKA